ncbi:MULTISPECIES: amino acid adenylation domain-containing protein [Actinosynnema]|uniref:non-ribosomal peptide synthetase n=1 Tax=Actinosynnema TaxID=40566 RepID=UPI0020A5D194|nr:amino acid adenylation domain-containing protein [Actinosynnema pretiosum]
MTTTTLDALASDVLGADVDPARSFVASGGDSLRAMRLVALARERLGLRLPVADLLGGSPLAEVFAGATPDPVRQEAAGDAGPGADGRVPPGGAATAGSPVSPGAPADRGGRPDPVGRALSGGPASPGGSTTLGGPASPDGPTTLGGSTTPGGPTTSGGEALLGGSLPSGAPTTSGVPASSGAAALPGHPATGGLPTTPGQPVSSGELSPAQRGMWLIERVTGGSPYNLVFLCFVESGALRVDALEGALALVAARHPGLRTVYRDLGDDQVAPVVLPDHRPPVERVVVEGGGFAERVRRVAAERGRAPFDLAAAPAHRLVLVERADGRQAVVLAAHHMVLDGWAVGLLLEELFARHAEIALGAPTGEHAPGPSAEVLARAHERARADGDWDRAADFWATHLAGVPTVLEPPADRPRPEVRDAEGARTGVDLGPEATAIALRRAHELGVTPFAYLLAAFGLALSRWTGARRLLVGVPLTGRDSSELTGYVGVAGNLVPVLVEVDDDATTADHLRSVHRSLALSIAAGALPFDEAVARLGVQRSPSGHPLVQVSFGMHDQLVPQEITTPVAGLRVEEGHGGGAQFDLSLLIGRSAPALAGHLEYSSSLYSEHEVRGFADDFATAVAQLALDTRLEDARCLSPARLARLADAGGTPRAAHPWTVDGLFREVVRRAPDAIAVREGEVELTYAGLAAAAARQAALLRASGVRPGDRVLLGLERSIAEVVAALAVIALGAAYVGVDLSTTPAHTDRVIGIAAPTAALVAPEHADRIAALGVPVTPTWSPDWESRPGDELPEPVTHVGSPAYTAFTSGSTGKPKGVLVPHRAVVRLVHDSGFVRLGPGERVLRLSPLAFDASTLELWGPLLTGATLEVLPAGLPTPGDLAEFLLERRVTVAWLTAGLFRLVVDFAPHGLGGLRQLLTGGDVVPHEHVARLLRAHPGLVVTNGYGPTENTTFTTTHSVTDPDEVDGPLPIGTPLPGTGVHVLDERGRLVPPGAVGELHASGAGLADGYLDDEAETARAFGRFSPDVPERLYRTGDLVRFDSAGRLRFLGRRDDQVKLRGYRVELSAVAAALTADERVKDAVVAVTEGDSADKRLMAAVVPEPGVQVGTAELRDALAGRLPSYMVPVLWALVDRVPLTGNGKVDRRALAAVAGPPSAPPPTADLSVAVGLFAEAVGGEATDYPADADFFTVGGNSLGVVRLVKLVRKRTGASVRVRDFLRDPTPAGLRRLVEEAR